VDSNRIATQIGDLRFNASLEYRFGTGGILNHALFIDAGNIWTRRDDPNRPGGQISGRFLRELAVSVGYGIRFDFNYFVVRFDLGVPIHDPGFPEGERWIFTPKPEFYKKAEEVYGTEYRKDIPKFLYPMRLNFGIGFPF
jgi:outer membrane protein assembly factor BamA